MSAPAPLEEHLITYQWTHQGLVADVRDGGRLYGDANAGARVGTYCDATHQPLVMTVKRRVRDDGHVLTIARHPEATRVFLAPGDGTDPASLPHLWREALGVWCVLKAPVHTGKWRARKVEIMDRRWRALLDIDWNTTPNDNAPVEAPAFEEVA